MAPERYSSCPARARKYVRGDTDDRDPPALAARAVFAVVVYSSGAGPEAGESYRCRERKQRPRRPRASRSRAFGSGWCATCRAGTSDWAGGRRRASEKPRATATAGDGTERNRAEQNSLRTHATATAAAAERTNPASRLNLTSPPPPAHESEGKKCTACMEQKKKGLHIFRSFFIREEKFMQISTHTHQSLIISAPNGGPIAIIAPAHQSPPSATTSSIVHHHQDQQRNHHHYRQQLAARSSTIPYHTSRQALPPAGWWWLAGPPVRPSVHRPGHARGRSRRLHACYTRD